MKKDRAARSQVVEPSEEDKTKPFSLLHPRPGRQYWLLAALLLAAVVGVVLLLQKKGPVPEPKRDRLAVQLKVNEILAMEAVVRQERKKLLDQFSALSEKGGLDTSAWDPFSLSREQGTLLDQKAGSPAAADYFSGLAELARLQGRIRQQEELLGTPHLVAPGETHFQIALAYLTGVAGQTEETSREILKRTPLKEPLMPGFKVWNFWLQGEYVTAVTQGDAPLTPEEAASQAQQRQREEKERALSRLNALYFLVNTAEKLQKRGILSGGFLKTTRLAEIKPEDFRRSIDLRQQRRIRFSARSLKLKKISAVTLFPSEFTLGADYSLRIGPLGRWAQVTILKPVAFRGRRIVIAAE